ncbi:uncharacterized protein [Spinacia oleracea]|uniref:Transposase Tnp1/En/Spm-like domain-containing protein n=1 Tax=Spinacia oleracea TaxID=3562 RepID=A0ABM3R4H2_SPIOL|nr:uncharacterized protein LOC130465679 [Spinacia oleracea]
MPFFVVVLASQVGQVYYVHSHNEPQWCVVIKTIPRNFYYFTIEEIDDSDEDGYEDMEGIDVGVVNIADDNDIPLDPRVDVSPTIISASEEEDMLDDDEENSFEEDEEEEEFCDDISDEEDCDDEMHDDSVSENSEYVLQCGFVLMDSEAHDIQQHLHLRRPRNGPFRGPSRAKKYKKLRLSQPRKLKICIPKELGAVVGDKANQFVAECSDWVKICCPINVVSWHYMPEDKLDRLYGTIKDKYDLPPGDHIDRALEVQCMSLFRHWRERMKKKRFTGKALNTAISNVPDNVPPNQWEWLCHHWNSDKQNKKSETNKLNAKANKLKSTCGAKSSARILFDMQLEEEVDMQTQREIDFHPDVEMVPNTEENNTNAEPLYIKAWTKLKRHADGNLCDEAEVKLLEFQQLHEKEIQEKGVDNLSIPEAFTNVLGYRSGYARGLGKGAPVIPKKKKNVANLESDVQHLQNREVELLEAMKKLENEANEARERERQREVEMKKREEQLRADLNDECQKKMDIFMNNLQAKCFNHLESCLIGETQQCNQESKYAHFLFCDGTWSALIFLRCKEKI